MWQGIGTDQEIPDRPIKITFLEKVELHVGQVLSLGLVSWAVAPVTPCWAHGFLLTVIIFFHVEKQAMRLFEEVCSQRRE